MKDKKDPGTIDGIPAKRGAPCINPLGPMTATQRKQRSRELLKAAGLVERVFRLDAKTWEKFLEYCDSHEKSADELVNSYMTKLVATHRGTRKRSQRGE